MPGTEVVRKQTTLGGAAGVAVLAFALVYRFFPDWIYITPAMQQRVEVESQLEQRKRATPPLKGDLWTGAVADYGPQRPAADSGEFVQPPETVALTMGPPLLEVPTTKVVAAILKRANQALDAGRLIAPRDNNALALFQQALVADKANVAAKVGLERIRNALREQTNAAIEHGDIDESEKRISALQAMPGATPELDTFNQRLNVLRTITPMLIEAANLLRQGHATEPPEANALNVYRKVLEHDSSNKLADQGLAQIERDYLDRALAAAAQDDFSDADKILADTASIRPGSQALLDTHSRIQGLRQQRAGSVLEQARSALDSGNPDMAEQLSKRALALSPDVPGIDEFNQKLSNARLYASFAPGQRVRDKYLDRGGSAPELVVIPTGSFLMGSPNNENGHRASEEPQREVKISTGFALSAAEITVGEFREFVKAIGYVSDAEKFGGSSVYDESSGRMNEVHGVNWQHDYHGESASERLPVIHVSWNDAQAYVVWLSERTGKRYRLPSETEFEYALRAGTRSRFWWGEGTPAKVLANITGDGDRSPSRRGWSNAFSHYTDGYWGPAPIRSFSANPFGLYDMDGNVSEWIEDCWHDNYTRAPSDSRTWLNLGCENHVVRGGSWGSAAEQVRSAYRTQATASTRSARIGIRLARDL